MKQYKILVFKHLLKNNKIANKGDVVKESQLINVKHSVDGKFVEEVKLAKKADAKKGQESKKNDSKK